jgi:hypothetical protein
MGGAPQRRMAERPHRGSVLVGVEGRCICRAPSAGTEWRVRERTTSTMRGRCSAEGSTERILNLQPVNVGVAATGRAADALTDGCAGDVVLDGDIEVVVVSQREAKSAGT